MRFLRTNTAVIVTVGPFYDKTDGVTIETALTITNERITLTADTDAGSAPTNILDNIPGATAATANDLNYITGNDAGMMQLELAAADVNRLGRMFLSITDAANHVPVFHEFMVVPALVYDTYFASSGGATFPAATLASTTNITAATGIDVTKILGTAVSTPATAGILDVNVKNMNNVTATPITTIKAVQGLAVDGVITTTTNLTTNNDKSGYSLTAGERDNTAAAILDLAAGVETDITLRQSLRLMVAALVGKLSGAATTTVVIRNPADLKDRVTATVDADGNRTDVTLDTT